MLGDGLWALERTLGVKFCFPLSRAMVFWTLTVESSRLTVGLSDLESSLLLFWRWW
jgi:hypothetical protein